MSLINLLTKGMSLSTCQIRAVRLLYSQEWRVPVVIFKCIRTLRRGHITLPKSDISRGPLPPILCPLKEHNNTREAEKTKRRNTKAGLLELSTLVHYWVSALVQLTVRHFEKRLPQDVCLCGGNKLMNRGYKSLKISTISTHTCETDFSFWSVSSCGSTQNVLETKLLH